MKYQKRDYPLFSACGLNCGLCPRHQMDGASKCPGCAGEGFLTKHPKCGVLSCSQRKGLEYCYQCSEYPCRKYDGADAFDSFITHKNQLRDNYKAKRIGIESYKFELDQKINALEKLLANYDDGRRKSFLCTAVNLLELADIVGIMARIENEVSEDETVKEKASTAVWLLQSAADRQGIDLKLRKKTKP